MGPAAPHSRWVRTQDDRENQMSDTVDVPEISAEQMDAVLRFLPIFQQPGYSFGEVQAPEGQFPYYAESHEVLEFVQVLYETEMVFPFNWNQWQEEARQYMDQPEKLASADLLTLRKLLTTHVRVDRFSEGHLGQMLENGHVTAILKRLGELRARLPETPSPA
jgi:hypothetical protein